MTKYNAKEQVQAELQAVVIQGVVGFSRLSLGWQRSAEQTVKLAHHPDHQAPGESTKQTSFFLFPHLQAQHEIIRRMPLVDRLAHALLATSALLVSTRAPCIAGIA
jgi:hypothetical protein